MQPWTKRKEKKINFLTDSFGELRILRPRAWCHPCTQGHVHTCFMSTGTQTRQALHTRPHISHIQPCIQFMFGGKYILIGDTEKEFPAAGLFLSCPQQLRLG